MPEPSVEAVPGGSAGAGRSTPRTRSRTRTCDQPSSFSTQASTRPSAEPATSSTSRSGVSTHSRLPSSRWNASPWNSRPSSVSTKKPEPSGAHGPGTNLISPSCGVASTDSPESGSIT